MSDDKIKAVIDSDFFIKLTNNDREGKLFMQIMEDLHVQPAMHKYVYETELKKSETVKKLVSENLIEVYQEIDFITDKEEYEEYFLQAYEYFNSFEFPSEEDLFTYHAKDESLGEIRSLYLAKMKGYAYFLSDDGEARRFAKNTLSLQKKTIHTLSVYEALIKCKENGTKITYKQLNPIISQAFSNRKRKQEEIKRLYMESETMRYK